MKTNFYFIATLIILFNFLGAFALNPEKDVTKTTAQIEMIKADNGYHVFKGVLLSGEETSGEFTYRLTSKRIGQSGSSKSNQAGQVDAKPGEKTFLSQFSTLLDANDQYEIVLGIYEKDILISTDTLRHPNLK
ncbi:MAG: curli-like amyloid fiber formation chaperone CsgH [Bacteroidota bacterium]